MSAKLWSIVNIQSSSTACGSHLTKEQAIEKGTTYRGGIVEVNESQRIVFVSEIYNC